MSVTIETAAAVVSSAWIPVVWSTSTDRLNGAGDVLPTGSVADSGGKCRFEVPDTARLAVNDVVTGKGFVTSTTYNTRHNITAIVDSTHYDTDIDFVTNDTSGTTEQTNDNFFVKCKVTVQIGALLDLTQVLNVSGDASFDFTQNHELAVGDKFLIFGSTGYDGVHTVTNVVDVNEVTTDTPYSATSTGAGAEAEELGIKKIEIDANSRFVFDVSNFLQTVMESDIEDLGGSAALGQFKGLRFYDVTFSEIWDKADGTTFENTAEESLIRRVSDTAIQHWETQNMDAFTLEGTSREFFSSADMIPIAEGDEWQLGFYANDKTQEVFVERLNANRGVVSSFVASGVFNPNTAQKAMFPLNSSTLTGIFDNDTIKYFDVYVRENPSTVQINKKLRFIKSTKCNDGKRLYWRNLRGGIDSFTFEADFTKTHAPKKVTYQKDKGFTFNTKDRGVSVLSSKPRTVYSVSTDWLTVEQAEWISKVGSSAEVWVDETGLGAPLMPIILRDIDTIEDDRSLIRHKIRYELANDFVINA